MTKAGRNLLDRLPEQVLRELAAIALTRATDVLQIENGTVELRPGMKKDRGAAIAAVEKTSAGLKIKFYDKLKALELLGTYLGLFGTGTGRGEEQSNLLEAIVASTKEGIDIRDIHELQQAADDCHDMVEQATAFGL